MAQNVSATRRSITGWTGRRAIALGTYPLDLSLYIAYVLRCWWRRGHLRDNFMRHATLAQTLEAGANPLAAILLLGALVGFTFAMPLLLISPQFAKDELAPLLLRIIGFELGTLLTAIVLIGHSGRAMAIELSNMRLHGEARGLEHLGIDLDSFFVAPRLIATCIAQLVLATYFTATALFGGVLLAGTFAQGEAASLAFAILGAVETGDLAVFIIKNLVFGLIIAGASCFSALQVRVAPTEVPQRAQQAATNSLVLVFLVNALAAVLNP